MTLKSYNYDKNLNYWIKMSIMTKKNQNYDIKKVIIMTKKFNLWH